MSGARLDHVSVTTRDLEASTRFYAGVLGLPVVGTGRMEGEDLRTLVGIDGARARWTELALGAGQVLELIEYEHPVDAAVHPHPSRPGATHVGLAVEELGPVLERLRSANATVSGVVELHEPGWEGARCAYATDPDGVTVELVERPTERLIVLGEPEHAEGRAQG